MVKTLAKKGVGVWLLEGRIEDCGIENILKKVFYYSYRTTPIQADSSTTNPSGFPLGMTVVGGCLVYAFHFLIAFLFIFQKNLIFVFTKLPLYRQIPHSSCTRRLSKPFGFSARNDSCGGLSCICISFLNSFSFYFSKKSYICFYKTTPL